MDIYYMVANIFLAVAAGIAYWESTYPHAIGHDEFPWLMTAVICFFIAVFTGLFRFTWLSLQ